MTKKDFKEKCSFHKYGKRNAIYYDAKTDERGCFLGYKYMVKSCGFNKKELFNILYDWVKSGEENAPFYVNSRLAKTDEERFKVSLMG
jgi:hypothetical protein